MSTVTAKAAALLAGLKPLPPLGLARAILKHHREFRRFTDADIRMVLIMADALQKASRPIVEIQHLTDRYQEDSSCRS